MSISAYIFLDMIDSMGRATRVIDPSTARLMALHVSESPIWYGFFIKESAETSLLPGNGYSVELYFLDDQGSKESFPRGASILFGDGISTRGFIRLLGN
ncbi:hypothetical protein [Stenotrophomonas sp. SY1]|uniref:hypothetical protein n=1 Tax=Stenotrophomonas sp. SY1 TaxID=477235 RepID=UPI001E358000|nr:hypothetical protein [Stenotrophomonas sp. SY1]MCD9088699.1 hypothetical protein [Stenotrophomonas sp. SY1]